MKLEKPSKHKYWIGRIWLLDELFYYKYPFYLPNLFQTKLTKDPLEIRFKFIQVFSSLNIEKVFLIQDDYKIIYNGNYYFTKEFNTHDISEGFVIYEKLSI